MTREYDPDRSGDSGVTQSQAVVEGELRWAFRRQNTVDFGIDAHIEVISQDRRPTGKLVGVQIKSGPSYFRKRTEDGIIYRPSRHHVDYWLHHSLPVLIFLVDLDAGSVYWEWVSDETLVPAGDGWKILVPGDRILDEAAGEAIRQYVNGPAFSSTRSHLAFARPLMEMAERGALVVEASQWVNKSSGRGSMTFNEVGRVSDEPLAEWGLVWSPDDPMGVLVRDTFEWADFEIDEPYYDIHEDAEGVAFMQGHSLMAHFGLGRVDPPELRPYEVAAGELALYRFTVSLSELGRAYLVVERYVEERAGRLPTG